MKVLLTGACGRIGPYALKALVEAGHQVTAVDRSIRNDLAAPIRPVNLLDRITPYRLLEGQDALIHLANHSGSNPADPQLVHNENVTMNFNLFEAAAQLGVGRILFAGSVQAISGNRTISQIAHRPSPLPYLPADGGFPANPGNEYGLSKQIGENQLAYYCSRFPIHAAVIRFPGVFSPAHLRRMLDRKPRELSDCFPGAPADELFTFLPVADAAALLVALLAAPLQGLTTLFPCSPANTLGWPVSQVIETFYPNVPQHQPMTDHTPLVDTTAITRLTGWQPTPEADLPGLMD